MELTIKGRRFGYPAKLIVDDCSISPDSIRLTIVGGKEEEFIFIPLEEASKLYDGMLRMVKEKSLRKEQFDASFED